MSTNADQGAPEALCRLRITPIAELTIKTAMRNLIVHQK
jgi:hypothetical protein